MYFHQPILVFCDPLMHPHLFLMMMQKKFVLLKMQLIFYLMQAFKTNKIQIRTKDNCRSEYVPSHTEHTYQINIAMSKCRPNLKSGEECELIFAGNKILSSAFVSQYNSYINSGIKNEETSIASTQTEQSDNKIINTNKASDAADQMNLINSEHTLTVMLLISSRSSS